MTSLKSYSALGLLLVFALSGCSSLYPAPGEVDTKSAASDFTTVDLPHNDPELARAAVQARKSWPVFVSLWTARKANQEATFAVKIATVEGDITEHFWLDVTAVKGDFVSGAYDCDGTRISRVRKGSVVTVRVKDLEDWLVSDSDQAFGGFSIMYMGKAVIMKANNLDDTGSERLAMAREALKKHWQSLVQKAGIPGNIQLGEADIATIQQFYLLEKLYRGNFKHEASARELAVISALPEEVVLSIRQFTARRMNSN